jgi:DNA polymerase (family X)
MERVRIDAERKRPAGELLMNLVYGQKCAERLITWLLPFAEKIAVAGSIRRGRPEVGDVDLVAIPRTELDRDLLGNVTATRNLMAVEVKRRAAEEGWTVEKDGESYLVWQAKAVQVDLWFCTRKTWGTVLMCRTGSKEHNIWLAQRAQARGGHWNPHHGLTVGRAFMAEEENDIYLGLGLEFIQPVDREMEKLRRIQ